MDQAKGISPVLCNQCACVHHFPALCHTFASLNSTAKLAAHILFTPFSNTFSHKFSFSPSHFVQALQAALDAWQPGAGRAATASQASLGSWAEAGGKLGGSCRDALPVAPPLAHALLQQLQPTACQRAQSACESDAWGAAQSVLVESMQPMPSDGPCAQPLPAMMQVSVVPCFYVSACWSQVQRRHGV